MHYILGLGNPEKKYNHTRHNVGRDMLLKIVGETSWKKDKHANALTQEGTVNGEGVMWLLPETFMNKSGDTARYISNKMVAKPDDFLVIYDDVDLPLGEIKISIGRGDGGHNGIKSIIDALKSKEFVRIRVGVARKSFLTGKVQRPAGAALADHVLSAFTSSEQKKVAEVAEMVSEVIKVIVDEGVEKAMNKFN
jgi:PTH1 family peptidyl-tRNA hydrolase